MSDLQLLFEVLRTCDETFVQLKDEQLYCEVYNQQTGTLSVNILDCGSLNENELFSLNQIKKITGDLIIRSSHLKQISCFNYLLSVNKLIIKKNEILRSISGFNTLTSINSLEIGSNKELKNIDGFNSLFSKNNYIDGYIKITSNGLLENIRFLSGIKKINSSFYLHYNGLTSLQGLEQLESISASLSLSSNKLTSLKELKNLKNIDGMLGLVNNQLKSLEGLESLEHLKTVKWGGHYRTIALNVNPNLIDISALKNIQTDNSIVIIKTDSFNQYTTIPDKNSTFNKNMLEVHNNSTDSIVQLGSKLKFPKIKSIFSNNANSDEEFPLENLIQGAGISFSNKPPYGSISKKCWSTKRLNKAYSSYFKKYEPIVIDIKLANIESFDSVGIFSSRITFGDSIKDFTLEFSNTGTDLNLSMPISKVANDNNPFDIELFKFTKVKANFIRLSILSNHKEIGLGGSRVGFQEFVVVRDASQLINEIEENTTSNICQYDFIRPLLEKKIGDYEYDILNIRPEFSLDHIWKPNMSYNDFIKARGLGGRGPQLKRINLSKWGDKIYMHHFLKEHGIKGMPVKLYSNRQ
ncbi:MAG: hypothetical protein QM504_16955, partial [Pseudomonadota bacterium]